MANQPSQTSVTALLDDDGPTRQALRCDAQVDRVDASISHPSVRPWKCASAWKSEEQMCGL